MIQNFKSRVLGVQAGFVVGFLAYDAEAGAGNSFSTIARNISEGIEELPGLITGLCYLVGLLMAVMGIMKVKDHVENPTQTPMKDGAIRLAAGGALFALPILMESMLNMIGTTGFSVEAPTVSKVGFNVR